ncbi:MAG TPA: hypothetical protein VKB19_20715 [Pedobacter sp.]|nr:hypothetical protein [Pedobacter sp.]
MKRILPLVLFSLLTSTAFGQMNADYNYSLALRAFSIGQMPRILDESGAKYFTNSAFNGVMVKFNDNQISYRLNGTYYNRSKRFFNNCETCGEANGKLADYSFKLGFEKSFNYARIQPYFAFDIGYRSNTFTGDLENRNELKDDAAVSDGMEIVAIDASKMGLVITPVIGLKINPVPQVSIFAEGNLDFFYFYERQETTWHDIDNTRSLKKYYKSEFLLNPFSVGIQVHFGNNK